MADNLGPMAWLFLPENELPQWQHKIALHAKNPAGRMDFLLHLEQFFASIELAHFPD